MGMRVRSDFFSGRYLFHLHTTFTDGQLAVDDYFQYAVANRIDRLIFLEHIRKHPVYCVAELAARVKQCSIFSGVEALLGFEAKLVAPGTLDISDEHLSLAKVVGIAEHSFAGTPESLRTTFVGALNTLRSAAPNIVAVWVHPGLWFRKQGRSPEKESSFLEMVAYANQQDVFLERNLRYGLVSDSLAQALNPTRMVTGVDAHRFSDLDAWNMAVRSHHKL
jgi:histidinol phosphatase-like PHP family hydrolase